MSKTSKVDRYVSARLEGMTDEEANEEAGYSGATPSSAIEEYRAVKSLKELMHEWGEGVHAIAALEQEAMTERQKQQRRARAACIEIRECDALLRRIELLRSSRPHDD